MQEITKDTRQIVLSPHEAMAVCRELENAFVLMDIDTNGGQYSMHNMQTVAPALVQLFKCLRR